VPHSLSQRKKRLLLHLGALKAEARMWQPEQDVVGGTWAVR